MSLAQYKTIDLTIFAAIVTALEIITRLALNFSPGEIFSFSSTLAVTLIVFVRWGKWGLIHAVLGGLAYTLINQADTKTIAIYCIGNLGISLALLVLKKFPHDKIRQSLDLRVLYCLVGFLGMCIARTVMAFILEGSISIVDYFIRYFSVDALNGVITVIVISIAAKQDGVLEDQLSYLYRISEEEG